MNDQIHTIGRLAYEKSTHAPVFEQYRGGDFETVGNNPDPGKPWRIDGRTGTEIHALGGPDHRYSTDFKVGSSYPATVFVFGTKAGSQEAANHEELEQFLKDHTLWSDAMKRVMVTQSVTGGPYLKPGLQFRPPERAPSLDRVSDRLRDQFGLDDHELLDGPHGFQAMLG